jgi:hypothetical protein
MNSEERNRFIDGAFQEAVREQRSLGPAYIETSNGTKYHTSVTIEALQIEFHNSMVEQRLMRIPQNDSEHIFYLSPYQVLRIEAIGMG